MSKGAAMLNAMSLKQQIVLLVTVVSVASSAMTRLGMVILWPGDGIKANNTAIAENARLIGVNTRRITLDSARIDSLVREQRVSNYLLCEMFRRDARARLGVTPELCAKRNSP